MNEKQYLSLSVIVIVLIAVIIFILYSYSDSHDEKRAFFSSLGQLPGGGTQTIPYAVSEDGQVVVGRADTNDHGSPGFVWTKKTGMQSLGHLPNADYSPALGVSKDGTVVIGQSGTLQTEVLPYRWTLNTGMIALGNLSGGDGSGSANGITSDGKIIVGMANSISGDTAFIYDEASGMRSLGSLVDPGQSEATAVTLDGSIIVGGSLNNEYFVEPFHWSEETGMIGLGDIPGSVGLSVARAVSSDGSVIVGDSYIVNNTLVAFFWTKSTGIMQLPDFPEGQLSCMATGITGDGSVIVGYGFDSSGKKAAYWINNTIYSLEEKLNDLQVNISGWKLQCITAITPDGKTIVGYGSSPAQILGGWIAYLPKGLGDV